MVAQDIKENFYKLPLTKKYFNMLHIIQFLCYYITTLKQLGKTIELKEPKIERKIGSPSLFPPLPITKLKREIIDVSYDDLFSNFDQNFLT
jgi:hypothetical protein